MELSHAALLSQSRLAERHIDVVCDVYAFFLTQFQTTQNHVSHLMCASADREFKHELSRFYDQVVDDTPAFSPLGICVLTRQLLVGIIGGIATFLAIVLQFHVIDRVELL
ncbi:uncharacterized protein LOC124533300 isoform X1 [Vanessa cardui]|uniref:uncharacterized protein LOC124532691 isoform X1 n=1 Tax=Vanessa cardui TaxID=171605 RepID=UPI001F14953F|nr:uncharacterized protein LOC124532691 isoform X1 [Vanessa cardui]XP_046964468.1 uncharacterized protein LOC124533297 isoform X1 [Vanessa cardui]XP_046964470.1 uncharacterized protein LOC124533298 isoform X1 [Vanessa cardui]XP_046964472.1 uncharacterized protein LOC124533299 isoform X1 [Vanessa cardui]XP_046964474.1 uncharacterized protein LOC124533300 isoform X1 [Vanessa cardui]